MEIEGHPHGVDEGLVPSRAVLHGPHLLDSLKAVCDGSERENLLRTWMRDHGFDALGCGRALISGDHLTPLEFLMTSGDANWVHRYFECRYHEIDPRLGGAVGSRLPWVWSTEALAAWSREGADTARRRCFIDDLGRAGLRSGLMVVVPMKDSAQRLIVSLGARTSGDAWITEDLIGRSLLLASCLQSLRSQQSSDANATLASPDALTVLQREILARVVHGMPDKVIASELDLNPHNVDYHLRRLRQRFGARNRVQLCRLALNSGSFVYMRES